MHTDAELDRLQVILDASATSADGLLRETFDPAAHVLSARQLARYFDRSRGVALATVTANGEPRVAPVGAVFHRAKFHVPTAEYSKRVAHIRQRPAVSLTHFVLSSIAVIVHGTATLVGRADPDVAALDTLHDGEWWRDLRAKNAGIYIRIEPEHVYAWAATPSEFPTL
jgi:uncharacterized pyridoxamine 5'-phosphate oxidase family protein